MNSRTRLLFLLPQVFALLIRPPTLALMSDTAPVAASTAVPAESPLVEGMEKLAVEGEEPEEEGLTLRALVSSKEAGQSLAPCRILACSRRIPANLIPFWPQTDIFLPVLQVLLSVEEVLPSPRCDPKPTSKLVYPRSFPESLIEFLASEVPSKASLRFVVPLSSHVRY